MRLAHVVAAVGLLATLPIVQACAVVDPITAGELADRWLGVDGDLPGPVLGGCETDCDQCIRLNTGDNVQRHGEDAAGIGHSEPYADTWTVEKEGSPLVLTVDGVEWRVRRAGVDYDVDADGSEFGLLDDCLASRH